MLITMLIPESAEIGQVESIVDDVITTCENCHNDLIGGHTEVSLSVNRFVLSGVCIGKKRKTPFKKFCPLSISHEQTCRTGRYRDHRY